MINKFYSINLPPTQIAKPLPVSKNAAANGIFTTDLEGSQRSNKKRKRNKDNADDTPKAFLRLMMMKDGKKLPKGLDDGVKETKAEKKRKLAAEKGATVAPPPQSAVEKPTIRPGEKMSEFSMRVDQALPMSGLLNKTARGGKDPLGLKLGRTKKEKKMHKMYDEWREQEKKIQEKREEAMEDAEEEAMDEDGQMKWKVDIEASDSKKKGKGKKRKVIGEMDDGHDDPWAQLKRSRAEAKVGLHDVVQAPPTFTKAPREKFKMSTRGAKVEVDNVPNASGSLRRREELGEVRRSVVEGYRAMMAANKAKTDEE